ncbi:hypothetical protein XU18_1953 [Perkinsela sp. CCAP 1560/4]|nr:hypothetical protein XU18_1953 [Perkinsela sp. CCAP 1560/4]|eukprot:KNH07421.1 hypothetical protein XU18_1953 [Perkinsela sp. CCAP 1560/4]
MELSNLTNNRLTGSIDLDNLPASMRIVVQSDKTFGDDPMEDHLVVVGWISTPPWGGSGDRQILPWGIPDFPGGETRERLRILCG